MLIKASDQVQRPANVFIAVIGVTGSGKSTFISRSCGPDATASIGHSMRSHGSAKKNMLLLKNLCGQNALKNVVLATTMWDGVLSEVGHLHQKELIDTSENWGFMVERSSMCFRVDNPDSEQHIVQHLASHDGPVTTDLQIQLVDERRRLNEMSAGQELQAEVTKDKRQWEYAVQETKTEMREAKRHSDHETLRALEDEFY